MTLCYISVQSREDEKVCPRGLAKTYSMGAGKYEDTDYCEKEGKTQAKNLERPDAGQPAWSGLCYGLRLSRWLNNLRLGGFFYRLFF